ncbi:anaerobic benzoate catabolism transcriptional regulator [Moraxella caprae]|uniref:Anaerobic benzoate catabolism transcriptional regulator n=1 Tax=Moraxella caprae TaxID=90240 RepID=A0A378QYH7_9GAMM|nr:helix-turn-helix transcriptional regulator [Moraxella caprae]STZ08096.1 anaerobic benzoate catabolism transcriptional regulator [Moraxella caprae]
MQLDNFEGIQSNIRLNIIRFRRERAFTQEQLANELGYSQAFINQIESGQKDCNLEHVYKLATILQCSIHDLLPNKHLNLGDKYAK